MSAVWILEHVSNNDSNTREGVFANTGDILKAERKWLDTIQGWGSCRYGLDNNAIVVWFEEPGSDDRFEISFNPVFGTGHDGTAARSLALESAQRLLFNIVVLLNTVPEEEVSDPNAGPAQFVGQWLRPTS